MFCATRRTVPGSIPGGATRDFFRGFPRRNHVPWGRLSPWKWVLGIYPRVKAAGAYGWRPTTLVVPNVKKIRGLNLPGTPWATSACWWMTFTFIYYYIINKLRIKLVIETSLQYEVRSEKHQITQVCQMQSLVIHTGPTYRRHQHADWIYCHHTVLRNNCDEKIILAILL
jgi:hypothetical protein